jgi:nuclease HARBI1
MTETALMDEDSSISSSSSTGSIDTVELIAEQAMEYADFLYTPIVDDTIDFNSRAMVIADLNESECLNEFRFRKHDLQEAANLLWPKLSVLLDGTRDKIVVLNGYTVPYETGLLMLLYRLARPRRLRPEMEKFFKMRKSKISATITTFSNALFEVALPYLSDPSIFSHRFRLYSDLIFAKSGGAVQNVWGFIDGTLRKTCRPNRFQRIAYSGHKRMHGIKFQSVVTPDGLIALLHGPVAGSRHDSFMLAESELLPTLAAMMPANTAGVELFSLYGDPAYPQSQYIFGGFRNPAPGSNEARWNTQMSKVREVVEWLFKEIITQWSFLDFKPSMKIFLFPVGKYFVIAGFLTNLRTCCYGSQTASYFSCLNEGSGKMTMEEYINLVV